MVVNPRQEAATVHVPGLTDAEPLLVPGVTRCGNDLVAEGFAYGVYALAP